MYTMSWSRIDNCVNGLVGVFGNRTWFHTLSSQNLEEEGEEEEAIVVVVEEEVQHRIRVYTETYISFLLLLLLFLLLPTPS